MPKIKLPNIEMSTSVGILSGTALRNNVENEVAELQNIEFI
jgi:hypothetical protein